MIVHRWLAFGLIVVESLTLVVTAGAWLYALAICAVALVGALGYCAYRVPMRPKAYALAIGAAGFGASLWFGVVGGDAPLTSSYAIMQTLARYLIFAQTLDFFMLDGGIGGAQVSAITRVPGGTWTRLPWALPFTGVVAMGCASHVVSASSRHDLFLVLAGAFSVLFTLFYAVRTEQGEPTIPPTRPRRGVSSPRIIGVAVLTASAFLGLVSSLLFYRNIAQIDDFFTRVLAMRSDSNARGFSDQARLTSINDNKNQDADSVAVRVQAANEPGYLRAYAYSTFDGREWKRPPMNRQLAPLATPKRPEPSSKAELNTFVLRDPGNEVSTATMEVWPASSIGEPFVLPQSAVRLFTRADSVKADTNLGISTPLRGRGMSYRVSVAGSSLRSPLETLTPVDIEMFTSVPEVIDPRVRDLATSITSGCSNTAERIAAVESYFSQCEYRFGITVPPGENPLNAFLLRRLPAHCEYYASGAAVLLRLSGVPCRYVTGFVVAERGMFGGHWVARNRDAHAWVEAWDSTVGTAGRWMVVECTPGEGVPRGTDRSRFLMLYNEIAFLFATARNLLAGLSLHAVLQWFGENPVRLICVIGIFGMLIAVAWRVLLRRRPRRKNRGVPVSAEVLELRALLAKLDRFAANRGLVRDTGETLLRFADRVAAAPGDPRDLEAVADWYRNYSAVRYLARPTTHQIQELADSLRDLRK